MFGDDGSYPSGVGPHNIPGWNDIDVEECLSKNADSSHCRNSCGEIQRMECMKAGHDTGEHWDYCYYCKQARLEAEN